MNRAKKGNNRRIMAPERFSKFKLLRHDLGRRIPLHVQLDPCGVCNHRCSFCFSNPAARAAEGDIVDTKNHPFLDTATIMRLLDDLGDLGTRAITLVGGGEPLLHKDIGGIIDKIVERGMVFGVITNLTTNGDLPQLEKAAWVRVSADAATPETYSAIHGTGAGDFPFMLRNFRRLASKTEVGAQFLVTPENAGEIPAAAQLFRDAGAAYIEFKPPLLSDAGANLDGIAAEIIRSVESAKRLQTEKFKVHEQLSLIWKYRSPLRPPRCLVTHYTAAVGCDGIVYPCCNTKYIERFSTGSLAEESFSRIWNRRLSLPPISPAGCPPCFYDDSNQALDYLQSPESRHDFFV